MSASGRKQTLTEPAPAARKATMTERVLLKGISRSERQRVISPVTEAVRKSGTSSSYKMARFALVRSPQHTLIYAFCRPHCVHRQKLVSSQ
jgi:hypothetical protein